MTAGPTWVWLDPVRFLGNRSTGRTGLTVARALSAAGAEVVLLYGPGQIRPTTRDRHRMEVHDYVTVDDLQSLGLLELTRRPASALVHAAAVADYQPATVRPHKLPSTEAELILRLVPTAKLLDLFRAAAPKAVVIAFKLESGLSTAELYLRARRTLERAGADYIVANDASRISDGRHPAAILTRDEVIAETLTEVELGHAITRLLAGRLGGTP